MALAEGRRRWDGEECITKNFIAKEKEDQPMSVDARCALSIFKYNI